jgi:D-alanyl-D-alanine carboxypeptidase/D-alanyl-D-alanine-endopeptidase (penicillin-binding protein 4)
VLTPLIATDCIALGKVPGSIEKILDAYKIPSAAISIVVQGVGSDAPLLSVNAATPRNPASTIKLLTTFVALDVLGPTYTWPTKLYALGPITDGVLDGDLLLKGYGDPNLVVEEFWKMLGELKFRGVTSITGDLVIDDTHFSVPPIDPGAFDEQPYRLYNVVPNAAMANYKAVEFQFSQAGDGKTVNIRTHPALPNLEITNKLTVRKGKCRGYQYGINMHIAEPQLGNNVIFSGAFPSGCRSHSMHRSVLNHDSYLFGTFVRLWKHWGGSISGSFRKGIAPERDRPIVTKRSRPLAEIIRGVNKWSNNVMTRLLLYSLATTKYDAPTTKQQGIEVLREYLQQNGIDDSDLIIDNGAGLSRDTRITATLLNELLQHAHHNPYMAEFVASLSIAGLDGTTRKRFRRQPEAGRMHLKTGRLDGVSAIAGFIKARDDKTYVASLLVNHKIAHKGPGNELQNALLKWVHDRPALNPDR